MKSTIVIMRNLQSHPDNYRGRTLQKNMIQLLSSFNRTTFIILNIIIQSNLVRLLFLFVLGVFVLQGAMLLLLSGKILLPPP